MNNPKQDHLITSGTSSSFDSDWRAVFLAAISGGSSVARALAIADEAAIALDKVRKQTSTTTLELVKRLGDDNAALRNELDRIETLLHELALYCAVLDGRSQT